MRKTFGLILATLLIAIMLPAWGEVNGDYTYKIVGGTAVIIKYNGHGPNVSIPNTLGGCSVKNIGDEAFIDCSGLTSITIPDSVTSIGKSAFIECSSLTSITIPNSVTSIGDAAFAYCENLKSITIPNGVTRIGDEVFLDCHRLPSIMIPKGVTSIGDSSFTGCTNLKSITIPDSVKSIGGWAFYYCTNLTSITIPGAVTSIGESAFLDCNRLRIYGKLGSYVQTYAKENKIPFEAIKEKELVITSVKANKTSVTVKTAITWTTTATGGSGTKTYRFLLYKDDKLLVTGKYHNANTFKFTPAEAGKYKVRVYVKDSTGTVDMKSANVIVNAPLSIASVKANKTSVAVKTAITWTTTATGGSGTKTYRFLLYKDDKLLVTGKYGNANTFKFTPTEAGKYKVRVYVKDSTGTVDMYSKSITVK